MNVKELPAKPKEQKKLRVAAYARVSAEMEMKLHSLEAQEDYFHDYIATHPDWELVEIYSDYGISGTTIQRPAFQRMLEDCRAGKIDLVVTKSVTRFARNTVILLQTIRELKALGIDCYFEKEDMHSISPDGELLVTLLAMYAEEEARSASENQIWRVRKRFEQGQPWVGHMLGYRLVDGKMTIIPEEAEVVKQIYQLYLSGMGKAKIAKALEMQGVTPPQGKHWAAASIHDILRNEKYIGNMLLQKSYVPDFRAKHSKVNRGMVRQYLVENSHEAIIDRETYQRVQDEIERRATAHCFPHSQDSKQSPNIFTGMIRCGYCGRTFVRNQTSGKQYKPPVWICPTFLTMGKALCPSQKIPESILIEKTVALLEVDHLTRESLRNEVSHITVPEHNCLIYEFTDGSFEEVRWKHPSRSQSWTSEMREAARQRTLNRYGKEKK